MSMAKKICKKCEQSLPLGLFALTPNNRDGRAGSCRNCINKDRKKYQKHSGISAGFWS